ncbi:MAG TPA: hypothetical protein VFW31_10355 [Candidatus Angelobacter sp.]|nr:hypothetical protein [Candidatus Angelobacter sp.]
MKAEEAGFNGVPDHVAGFLHQTSENVCKKKQSGVSSCCSTDVTGAAGRKDLTNGGL